MFDDDDDNDDEKVGQQVFCNNFPNNADNKIDFGLDQDEIEFDFRNDKQLLKPVPQIASLKRQHDVRRELTVESRTFSQEIDDESRDIIRPAVESLDIDLDSLFESKPVIPAKQVQQKPKIIPKRSEPPCNRAQRSSQEQPSRVVQRFPNNPQQKNPIPPQNDKAIAHVQPKKTQYLHQPIPSVLTLVQKYCSSRHSLCFPDMAMYDLIANSRLTRSVKIPDKFTTVSQYRTLFLDAVYEEMNLQMLRLGTIFRNVYSRISSDNNNGSYQIIPLFLTLS